VPLDGRLTPVTERVDTASRWRCEVPGKFRMVRHVLLPAACRTSSSKGQQSSFLSCRTFTADVWRWTL